MNKNLIELKENMSYILQCNLQDGSKPVHFKWLKDGRPLTLPSSHDSSSNKDIKIESFPLLSILSFNEVHRNHSGTYTCNVKNVFGTDSTSTRLLVKGYFILF